MVRECLANPTDENIQKAIIARCKSRLDFIFGEAKVQGRVLWPDEATFELLRPDNVQGSKPIYPPEVEKLLASPVYQQFMESPLLMSCFREIHSYAFDLFYTTYKLIKRGRPQLPKHLLTQILSLEEQGKNTAEQAKEQGLSVTPKELAKSKEVARKRRDIAKKRLGHKS